MSRFRPVPPPELTSNEHAKDYNEVKTRRPALATTAATACRSRARRALLWILIADLPVSHGLQAADCHRARRLLSENARNLALISIATNDALVASFKTKYFYKFWRPITAIHLGATDGNGKTTEDGALTTFCQTPCFPSYASNHASGSGASLEAMRRIYGAAGHAISPDRHDPGDRSDSDDIALRSCRKSPTTSMTRVYSGHPLPLRSGGGGRLA